MKQYSIQTGLCTLMLQPDKRSCQITTEYLQASRIKLHILEVWKQTLSAETIAEYKAHYLVVGIISTCTQE